MSMRCDVHEDDPEANEGTTGRKCVPSWTCRWVRVCATPDPSPPTNDGPHWFGGEAKRTLRDNQCNAVALGTSESCCSPRRGGNRHVTLVSLASCRSSPILEGCNQEGLPYKGCWTVVVGPTKTDQSPYKNGGSLDGSHNPQLLSCGNSSSSERTV